MLKRKFNLIQSDFSQNITCECWPQMLKDYSKAFCWIFFSDLFFALCIKRVIVSRCCWRGNHQPDSVHNQLPAYFCTFPSLTSVIFLSAVVLCSICQRFISPSLKLFLFRHSLTTSSLPLKAVQDLCVCRLMEGGVCVCTHMRVFCPNGGVAQPLSAWKA